MLPTLSNYPTTPAGPLLTPALEFGNGAGGHPGNQAIHATLLHLLDAKLLHLLRGVDLRWGEKLSVLVAHGAVFVTV